MPVLQPRVWIVRLREGGIEVPIRDPRVVKLYQEAGWTVKLRRWSEIEVRVRR